MATSTEKKFYEECKSMGIYSLDKASDFERAKLLASSYGIEPKKFAGIFMNCVNAEKAQKRAKENAEKRKQDILEQQKLKTTTLCGRERIIDPFTQEIKELQKKKEELLQDAKAYEDKASAVMGQASRTYGSITSQKSDWAIHGGIAEAIAGPAAGLAVELDTQRKNAEIDSMAGSYVNSAAALILEYQRMAGSLRSKAEDVEEEIKKVNEKIKRAKMLLVDPRPSADILKLMNVTNIETSSNKISLKVNLPKELLIFDDVKAIVDGSFWAHVYQNKEYVGSTRIVLPKKGLAGGLHSLSERTSLGLNGTENISVELEPEALCLMEQYSF